MDPTARAARRMSPGAYLSKGVDPAGAGVLNKREHARTEQFFKAPGQTVPGNPRNFDSHADAQMPLAGANPYGDWQAQRPQTAPVEVKPTWQMQRVQTQPWQDGDRLAMQAGINNLAGVQARAGIPPSPIHMPPPPAVMDSRRSAVEGVSGYQAPGMLPSAPMLSFEDMAMPAHRNAQLPLPPAPELDPRHAPYTVIGNPRDALLPRPVQEIRPGRGKPATMPATR